MVDKANREPSQPDRVVTTGFELEEDLLTRLAVDSIMQQGGPSHIKPGLLGGRFAAYAETRQIPDSVFFEDEELDGRNNGIVRSSD